jgi:hypothetical protein
MQCCCLFAECWIWNGEPAMFHFHEAQPHAP